MVDLGLSFRATICGIRDLAEHADAGVTHVLTILDPGWSTPSAFRGFGPHERLDLRFHDIIETIPDTRPVGRDDVAALLRFGRDLGVAHLLVHCERGLSRSSAALALILAQACPQRSGEEVMAEVVRLRPGCWPNLRVIELGDALLDRGGALVAAVGARYRDMLLEQPQLKRAMYDMGRGREVGLSGLQTG